MHRLIAIYCHNGAILQSGSLRDLVSNSSQECNTCKNVNPNSICVTCIFILWQIRELLVRNGSLRDYLLIKAPEQHYVVPTTDFLQLLFLPQLPILKGMSPIEVVQYSPHAHGKDVYQIWRKTLKEHWPITHTTFDAITLNEKAYQPADHYIALNEDDDVIGFVATQVKAGDADQPRGEIMLLLVHPHHHRRGIGTQLLERAYQHLESKGVSQIQLGGGGHSYFWPGVPDNLPDAIAFFQTSHWHFTEESLDMVLDLTAYETPALVPDKLTASDISIDLARREQGESVLAFVKNSFVDWHPHFLQFVQDKRFGDILIASKSDQGIVGALLLYEEPRWEKLIAPPVGAVGTVGVVENMRRQGIGINLVAKGTELLRDRGHQSIFLGWTYLPDWYAQLGYQPWRKYQMSWWEV